MKTSVIITSQAEGLHNWPEAREFFPEVGFLADLHRHVFHFRLEKLVTHTNRDIEFLMWKKQLAEYLLLTYHDEKFKCLNFKSMSCEMIAVDLLERFDCINVEVFEDGENGAKVTT